jgi:hypothetical protein
MPRRRSSMVARTPPHRSRTGRCSGARARIKSPVEARPRYRAVRPRWRLGPLHRRHTPCSRIEGARQLGRDKLPLEHHALAEIPSPYQVTPLMIPPASVTPTTRPAPLNGRNETLWFLAENDVDPEPKDHNGETPVDYGSGNYRSAQTLGGVPRSADPETVNDPRLKARACDCG